MPRHGVPLPPPVLAAGAAQHQAKPSPALREARLNWADMGNGELGHKPSKAAAVGGGGGVCVEKVVHCWYEGFPGV